MNRGLWIIGAIAFVALGLVAWHLYSQTPGRRKERALSDLVSGLPGAVRAADVRRGELQGATARRIEGEAADGLYSGNCLPAPANGEIELAPGSTCGSTVVAQLDLAHAAYSWAEVSCGVDANRAGFSTENWYQACTFVTHDLVQTDFAWPECEELSSTFVRDHDDARSDFPRVDLWWGRVQADCVSDVLSDPGALIVRGSRPAHLGPRNAWVVVSAYARISETDLGCTGGFLSCDPLIREPLMPPAQTIRDLVAEAG